MPMFYRARQSALKSKDGKKKWYPQLVKAKTAVTTDELAEVIAEKSSLTKGDIKNVLDNLPSAMALFLRNSMSVNLQGFGSFTAVASASGAGVDKEEEVNANQIKSLKVRFTPSYTRNQFDGTTRSMYKGIKFEKYDPAKSTLGQITPDPGGDDDDFIDPEA